jgi:hypothetical protein
MWMVTRHSGRSNGHWRSVYTGPEEKAREKFAKIAKDLRQGGVRLHKPDGTIVKHVWGPTLRMRW